MGDLAAPYFVIDQLDLRALTAINQVIGAIMGHHLAGGVPVKCRNSGIIPEDRYCKHQPVMWFGV